MAKGFLRILTGVATSILLIGPGNVAADNGSGKPAFEAQFRYGLDQNTWIVERRGGNAGAHPELQYYTPDAVHTDNSGLHIVAEKRPTIDPKTGNAFNYISGRIDSRQTFLYGKIEFRAKLPMGRGAWPALWLRTPPQNEFDGEIDVIEGYGSHPNIVQSTLHPWINGKEDRQYCAWLVTSAQPDSPRFHRPDCARIDNAITLPQDLSKGFHTYAVDWQPDHITWSIDGLPYFTVRDEIPKAPMQLVIYLAVSDHWDGPPDDTKFPERLDVDYVRYTKN